MTKPKLPAPPPVALDLWRQLYQLASRLQTLAPWRWMDDTHILGINNQLGTRLLSVLGNMGEVFGLVSYQGTVGANHLLGLLRGELSPEDPEAHFYQDALLLDFVPRQTRRKEDLKITIPATSFLSSLACRAIPWLKRRRNACFKP